MRGRRHQGLRPVRPDDPRLDDPGLRHLRQEDHRKDLRAMIHRECGVLKTSYEADMALYPRPIARWAIAALAVVFFGIVPLGLGQHHLSVANLVWTAFIGALGLHVLVG